MTKWGWVCFIVITQILEARGQSTAVGARSVSLAGISSCLEDSWAVANNPAGLAKYNHFSIASTLEQRYLMAELGHYALAVTVPVSKGSLGAFTSYSGCKSYIYQKFNLAFGMPLGENFAAGLSLVYCFQKAGNESSSIHQVSYQIGTIASLSDKTSIAFTAFNPFQLYYKSKEYASLPSLFKLGFTYQFTSSFIICSEVEKDLYYAPCLKIGSEYIIDERFYIRGGIRFFPFSWSFGAAVRRKGLLFEIASTCHQYLGYSPVVSLQYDFK